MSECCERKKSVSNEMLAVILDSDSPLSDSFGAAKSLVVSLARELRNARVSIASYERWRREAAEKLEQEALAKREAATS